MNYIINFHVLFCVILVGIMIVIFLYTLLFHKKRILKKVQDIQFIPLQSVSLLDVFLILRLTKDILIILECLLSETRTT